MADPSDLDLLARAVAGDGDAFAALAGPYQRAVFRHCYRMLGSGADAEDATQDVLERAWRKLATYDGSGPFGAWLQRIATNICLDELRVRRARISPLQGGQPLVTFFVGVSDVAATLEAAVARGGRVVQDATKVPGVTFGLLADPQGNVVGLAQAEA